MKKEFKDMYDKEYLKRVQKVLAVPEDKRVLSATNFESIDKCLNELDKCHFELEFIYNNTTYKFKTDMFFHKAVNNNKKTAITYTQFSQDAINSMGLEKGMVFLGKLFTRLDANDTTDNFSILTEDENNYLQDWLVNNINQCQISQQITNKVKRGSE